MEAEHIQSSKVGIAKCNGTPKCVSKSEGFANHCSKANLQALHTDGT